MTFDMINANDLSLLDMFIRIGVAIIIGCVIGVDREYKNRPAGLRTHVLVCLGSCMIALVECLFVHSMGQSSDSRVAYNFGRLCAQVISGIGFLGAGTIIMQQKKVAGLTTAASLWNTACLGIVTGYGYYWLSLFGCLMVLMVLLLLQKVIRVNAIKRVEVRFNNRKETIAFINAFFEKAGVKVLDLDFHIETMKEASSANVNLYTNIYTLHLPAKLNYTDLINHLASYPHIQSVRTTNS